MTRRKPNDKQLLFTFSIPAKELLALEGGSQDELSEFEFRFRQCLKETLDRAASRKADPLDRFEVAARMSRKLGREISKSHIDQWTAMSTIQRRLHVDSLKALCEVLADFTPMHFFVEACGFKALTPTEAVCAEYGANQLAERMLKSQGKDILNRIDDTELHDMLLKHIRKEAK